MAEGLCWCASDIRCPHGISQRMPPVWDDMEKIVDDILQQFDRKSIKRYLKKDLDGTTKSSLNNKIKDAYKMSDDVKAMMDKTKPKAFNLGGDGSNNKKRKVDPKDEILFSKTISTSVMVAKDSDDPQERPRSSSAGLGGEFSSARTPPTAPKGGTFTRDLMSSSLPKLPPRNLLPALNHTPSKAAVESDSQRGPTPTTEENAGEGIPKTNPMNPLQAESVIAVGLMRIADRIARRVLPWQAVLCPRAIESLQDLRLASLQTKHTTFMISMKGKLEEKVTSFLQKKEAEVDEWVAKEIAEWQAFLSADETDLGDFLQRDLQRVTHRAVQQDAAYRQRELQMANELDDHERDQTRELLNNFRRIVRASKVGMAGSSSGAGGVKKQGAFNLSAVSLFEDKPVNVEVRVLQDNIAKAQNVTTRKLKDMVRTNIRKQEESHDWLCSLADNATTASIAEEKLNTMYAQLDSQRQQSLDSLHSAMLTYQEQHNSILEAIVVFAGRIHQHASDYLQREQLVNRAFTSYLLGIISGEIKSSSQEQKKSSFAWETKSVLERGIRKDQLLANDFTHHISPLDRMVQEFKEKMKVQLEHITMKLQAVINGKENDVNARKALIHKKLAKHVNKSCNARRQRLKDATAVRRDEFELEALAVAKADDLTGDLRAAIDSVWVKEHLKERRIFEASLGRLERLEKTALIIWNKHAHLAVDVKEDYEDWLATYKNDRDEKVNRRKDLFDRDFFDWRMIFGKQFKSLGRQLRRSFGFLIPQCYIYNVEVALEKNLEDVEEIFEIHRAEVMDSFHRTRSFVEEYLGLEMQNMDVFAQDMRGGLLHEWRENLVRLDGAINRRIGGLKDMEADLEETIRLSILQHEVEANVFEQQSSARMEGFWIEWMQKMNILAKELIRSNEDYEIAKLGGKARARASQKDRQLDDMVNVAKDSGSITPAGKKASQAHAHTASAGAAFNAGGGVDEEEAAGSAQSDPIGAYQNKDLILDTRRMRVIIEDIKPDIYRDFTHKLTRGLERVRRDLGEGRQRLVPPYAVTKVLMKCCLRFYEQAKLSERCIGRISSRGVLLFSEGLPMHAHATFSIAAALSLVAQLPVRDNKLDCDDVFSRAEGIKAHFIVGLLAVIHSQLNEFGEYMLKSEIVWMCSVLEILPPTDVIQGLKCKGLREQVPKNMILTGIFSDDPVDLLNSMVDLPTDLNTVQRLTREFESALQQEMLAHAQSPRDGQSVDMNATHGTAISEDIHAQQTYNKAAQHHVMTVLDHRLPAAFVLSKLQPLLPAHDILILYALLGRPDSSMELSTHRVCQAVSLWRKISFSMLLLSLTSPSSEYPRLSELVAKHHIANIGNKRMGPGNINCMSPFQTISINIDYLTSIHGAPLSILQAMALVSKSGSVDIWLEDPKQNRRHERLVSEIREMVDLYMFHIPKAMNHSEFLQIVLPKNILETLESFDLNKSNSVPVELIRAFVTKDDTELNNNQMSMLFWSLCRINEDSEEPQQQGGSAQLTHLADTNGMQGAATTLSSPGPGALTASVPHAHGSQSLVTVQTGATHRYRVQTAFHGNTSAYVHHFFNDLNNYLHSMPYIDSNVIVGFLANALIPAAAYELVSDAMKLDLSAHNPMPTSAILFVGQRVLPIPEILQNLVLKHLRSKAGNYLLGVSENAFSCNFHPNVLALVDKAGTGADDEDDQASAQPGGRAWDAGSVDTLAELPHEQQMSNFINKLRVFIEVDILTKYRELHEIKSSDRHYGPAGNDPMGQPSQAGGHAPRSAVPPKDNFYWQELLYRRLNRLNQLLLSWRDVMLDEWANSLYSSRAVRYQKRIQLVIKSISVYHKQYDKLRDVIFQQRSNLINMYNTLLAEVNTSLQDITSLCLYHVNFIQRSLRRFEGEYDRVHAIIKQCLVDYIHHVSSIKRRAINRVNLGFVKLKNDLENSCNGLILGYTSGYAQLYFNNLIANTDRWKNQLLDLQGTLIVNKEKFMYSKEHIDRDLTLQIMDKLTANRMEYREFLQDYTVLSNNALAELTVIRNAYALYQKDANSRLILKIEKSVRECRKIRSAAEQEPLLEAEAMRDMKTILVNTKQFCLHIVDEVRDNCLRQLATFVPVRATHRQNLETKRNKFSGKWQELKDMLMVLVEDYNKEMQKVLGSLHVQALHNINMYIYREQTWLRDTFSAERALLILAFRKHFREYDLCEAAIFERFNMEVNSIVEEMIVLHGPARPPFIVNTLTEFHHIIVDSLESSMEDIMSHQLFNGQLNDSFTLQRLELAENFNFNLTKTYKVLQGMESRFLAEKQEQIAFIEDMSMTKNGDMVRPQVKAVLDLLISGIEIENDFHKGYHDLIAATQIKANDCVSELSSFVTRYNSMEHQVSIPFTISLFHQRVGEREYEVDTLLDASQNHMVADNSKLEVIYNNFSSDIKEWHVLTNQLVENAFHNAEKTYLSNLWPSPHNSPRDNQVAETRLEGDEDKYISKYKEILDGINSRVNPAVDGAVVAVNNQMMSSNSLSLPQFPLALLSGSTSLDTHSAMVPYSGATTPARPERSVTSVDGLVAYKGDTKLLMDNLTVSAEEEEAHRQKKLKKKQERLARKQAEEEEARKKARKRGITLPRGRGLPELTTVELQEGWFQCAAPEGYTYFHNPETGESLWELPSALRRPKHDLEEESMIETPRQLLVTHAAMYVPETVPIRMVDSHHTVEAPKDAHAIIMEVAEEARAVSALVVDTALDITRVIRGKNFYKYYNQASRRGTANREESIATLLGDRYNPGKLQTFLKQQEEDSDEEDDQRLRALRSEDPAAARRYDQLVVHEDADPSVNGDGRMIGDAHTEVDSELKDMLMDLGIGASTAAIMIAPADEIAHSSMALAIVQPNNWLQLGLGEGDEPIEASDSDGEDLIEGRDTYSKQLQHYSQTKELDLMAAAELESIEFENAVENGLCMDLLGHLEQLLQARRAHDEDKLRLQALAKLVKPANVISIFHELHVTWSDVDGLIAATLLEEDQQRQLAAELNKASSIQRQEKIIEHAEDIDELAAFLHSSSLSKMTSKRIAVMLVLNNILTPKKLAKLWARGEFDLDQLSLDRDDREELEQALSRLLAAAPAASSIDLTQFASLSFVAPMGSPVPAQRQPQPMAMASTTLDSFLDELPMVETDLDNPQESLHESVHGERSLHNSQTNSPSFLGLTRDGYKSFAGGWVEGLSENNEVYFYNVKTGQSTWSLTELLEQQRLENEQLQGQPTGLEDGGQSVAFYEGDHAIVAPHGYASSHELQPYSAPYVDPAAQYYDPAAQDPNAAYYDANGQYYDPSQDPNAAYYDANGQYYDPNAQYPTSQELQSYDPGAQHYGAANEYYDPSHGYYDGYPQEPTAVGSVHQPYLTDGAWNVAEALGVEAYQPTHKPRAIPTYSVPEAQRYAKEEGLARQVTMLQAQDSWQHELVTAQHTITSQKSLYLNKRQDIFNKLSARVETKLETFVNDIKAMQKLIKREMGEANATERDLRRLFEEDAAALQAKSVSSLNMGLRAEKLSFILESLEKFKGTVSDKYDSAFKQIEKFGADWEMVKAELTQVGNIFDEGIAANLEQCRLACEHVVKVFAYDQLKQVAHVKAQELGLLRKSLHRHLRGDSREVQQAREKQRQIQYEQWLSYETAKYRKLLEYNGTKAYDDNDVFDTRYKSSTFIEEELVQEGYRKPSKDEDVLTEEELALSFVITQLEMEESLGGDYDSVLTATQNMAQELMKTIADFDSSEKQSLVEDGSWFNKHREAMERHEQALQITLDKVRTRVQEGYSILQSRIEELDFEVERAAEEELNQHSLDQGSFYGSVR